MTAPEGEMVSTWGSGVDEQALSAVATAITEESTAAWRQEKRERL